jgi:hypothetical protein
VLKRAVIVLLARHHGKTPDDFITETPAKPVNEKAAGQFGSFRFRVRRDPQPSPATRDAFLGFVSGGRVAPFRRVA